MKIFPSHHLVIIQSQSNVEIIFKKVGSDDQLNSLEL